MGGHGVHREAEGVGNLFVAQSLGDTDEDVLLAVAQEVRPVAGVLTVSCHAEHREASRNVPWQSPCARSLTSAPSGVDLKVRFTQEVWALITMLIYAAPLHSRSMPWFARPMALHRYCILAFLTVLMTYFGVNYLLGGIHSYA